MTIVIRSKDQHRFPSGSVRFEGQPYGLKSSGIFVIHKPGEARVADHWHPYRERWFVFQGTVRATIHGEEIMLHAGDSAVIEAGVWHGFENVGNDTLLMSCQHDADVIVQYHKNEKS